MKDITNTILDEFRGKFLEKESNIVQVMVLKNLL